MNRSSIVMFVLVLICASVVVAGCEKKSPPVVSPGATADKKEAILQIAEARVSLEDRQKELGQLKEELAKNERLARVEAEVIRQNKDKPDKTEVKILGETITLGQVRNSLNARLAEIDNIKLQIAKTETSINDLQKKIKELSPPERRNDIPSDADLLKKVENLGPPATRPAG